MTSGDADWAAHYDIFDPTCVSDPYAIWDTVREQCPIGHSDRYGGSWLPRRMADVTQIARDIEHFSSREITVVPTGAS